MLAEDSNVSQSRIPYSLQPHFKKFNMPVFRAGFSKRALESPLLGEALGVSWGSTEQHSKMMG